MTINKKFTVLKQLIAAKGKAAIAFSGGVDSTLLCRAAHDVLGSNAVAITVVSPMLSRSEREAARSFAEKTGIRHIVIEEPEIDPVVAANPADRCYLCKKIEFSAIIRAAEEQGISAVFDGSNIDDLSDYRPGTKAVSELGVSSPLKDAGMTKNDIRELSRRLGLATWDKPAFACLASRIPYGETITPEKLARIDKAEEFLRSLGLRQLRVRCHGDIARIEVAPDERHKLFDIQLIDRISEELISCGFLYVCLELSGYRMGSMNKAISQEASRG